MIREGFNNYRPEPHEPFFRSCWECNGGHQHLKKSTDLHACFFCNRYFIGGRFLDGFESAEQMDEFLKTVCKPAELQQRP